MELCRIAGRGGDDLLTAGRCIHRRNVTRLVAHRERASSELVQALAAVCALARDARAPRLASASEEQLRAGGVERIAEALPHALARVAELTACLEDSATADAVARMIEAEREAPARAQARTRPASREGEEPCTTQAVPTAFASSPLRTTTSHGG
jgi:hypothetical protein